MSRQFLRGYRKGNLSEETPFKGRSERFFIWIVGNNIKYILPTLYNDFETFWGCSLCYLFQKS